VLLPEFGTVFLLRWKIVLLFSFPIATYGSIQTKSADPFVPMDFCCPLFIPAKQLFLLEESQYQIAGRSKRGNL
jgi:hypothetical protein